MSLYFRRLGLFALALLVFTALMPLGAQSRAAASGAYPTQQLAAASAGRIIYLAADGVTIKSIRPDDQDPRLIYTVKIAKGQSVANLSADPTGAYILYSLSTDGPDYSPDVYYLLHNGAIRKLPAMSQTPRWSPDGVRFVGEVATGASLPGQVFIYNVLNNTYLYLPPHGLPDWFPDGNRLVYTDSGDVFIYNRTTGAITRLTHFPHQENGNDWAVQDAHVLPGGQRIAFFGQEFRIDGQFQLGASGNGLQWFTIPVSGGNPQPWLDPEGNGLVAYASSATSNKVAYAGNAHSSACAAIEDVTVLAANVFPGRPVYANIPELNDNAENYVFVRGLAWAPSGGQVAFGVAPYSCAGAAYPPTLKASILYTWDVSSGGANTKLHKLVNGSYPVWVR